MPTQEERINTLESTVAWLQKRLDAADIPSVNHNNTMLLGLAYKQQADITEIKVNLTAIDQRLDRLEVKFDEHTTILTKQTSILTQILERLPNKS